MPADNSGTPVALLHRISNIVSSDQSTESVLHEMVTLTMNVTRSDACLAAVFSGFSSGESFSVPAHATALDTTAAQIIAISRCVRFMKTFFPATLIRSPGRAFTLRTPYFVIQR